jgi:hypothetical protein
MASKQIFFFAERNDLEQILREIESSNRITYSDAGIFDSVDVQTYSSYSEMREIGTVKSGDWNQNKLYLVYFKEDCITKRNVPLKNGRTRYAIYQDTNPKTIVFKPGGVFKDNVLVAGSIGTISLDTNSVSLFNQYSKLIKKTFSKIGNFYISPSAKAKLNEGWRLVTNDKSPTEYDLKPV